MLGLLGLLGAVVAGLAFDSGSDPCEDEHEPQDTPEGETWGVSAAFLGFGEDEDSGTDQGGTEPDGQPISNDTPTPIDPDRDMTGTAGVDQMTGGSGDDRLTARAGDDILHLGAGDYGHGGAGVDSFTLQDFGPGATLLLLDGVPLASLTAGANIDLAVIRLQAA